MIFYRNPLEQWFWEIGWPYIVGIVLVLLIWFVVNEWLYERKAKAKRKAAWLAMNETQRDSWRYYNKKNNFEAEEWEK